MNKEAARRAALSDAFALLRLVPPALMLDPGLSLPELLSEAVWEGTLPIVAATVSVPMATALLLLPAVDVDGCLLTMPRNLQQATDLLI